MSTQNKATKKLHILRRLIVFAISIALIGTGVMGGIVLSYIDATSSIDASDLKLNFSSFVYYENPKTQKPELLETLFSDQNRVWANLSEIPKDMQNAAVAIEDERFYEHPGVDLKRTIGAFLTFASKGKASYGGSTLTQQLIKNLTGKKENTPSRKVQEMWSALQFERSYSKNQILELYLNTIYLSQGVNGVGLAAKAFFDKDVSELTLAESASIIGITQFPTYYDPLINPKNNKAKQEVVLKKMLSLGYITTEQCDHALKEKLNFKKGTLQERASRQSYFMDQVVNDVIRDLENKKGFSYTLASKMVFNGGLKIYATIDPEIQSTMEAVFTDANNFPRLGNPQPQAAMVVIDPKTGYVKGIVGGRGEKTSARVLNRATQTLRQPGSSIKPLAVYAPALEFTDITPETSFVDEPSTFAGWSPKNWYTGFKGSQTVRNALAISGNIIPCKVLQKVGVNQAFKFLEKNLNITSLADGEKGANGEIYSDKSLAALALGGLTHGVSVLEMTAAYSPFINKGVYNPAFTYTKVLDNNGKVILENKKKSQVAMTENTASQMNSMLQSVCEYGVGTGAQLDRGIITAGKTGTTSDNFDRWFVGYTPYYVGGVWFGYDEPRSISTTYNPAMTLWKLVMDRIHKDITLTKEDTQAAVRTYTIKLCTETNLVATDNCPKTTTVYLTKSEIPKTCQLHKAQPTVTDAPAGDSVTPPPIPANTQNTPAAHQPTPPPAAQQSPTQNSPQATTKPRAENTVPPQGQGQQQVNTQPQN